MVTHTFPRSPLRTILSTSWLVRWITKSAVIGQSARWKYHENDSTKYSTRLSQYSESRRSNVYLHVPVPHFSSSRLVTSLRLLAVELDLVTLRSPHPYSVESKTPWVQCFFFSVLMVVGVKWWSFQLLELTVWQSNRLSGRPSSSKRSHYTNVNKTSWFTLTIWESSSDREEDFSSTLLSSSIFCSRSWKSEAYQLSTTQQWKKKWQKYIA